MSQQSILLPDDPVRCPAGCRGPRRSPPRRTRSSASSPCYAEQIGFDTILERGRLAAESLPSEIVYAGFSLGVMPAQMLAQTRPGATGALLFHACVPTFEFGRPWPHGIPLQIHTMEGDELGDLDIAGDLVETIVGA